MLERIRDKSLEELEGLMAILSQEQPRQGFGYNTRLIKEEEIDESGRSGLEGDRGVRRSISVILRFVKRDRDKGIEIGESRGSRLENRGEGDRRVSRGIGVIARFIVRSDDNSS